MQKVPNQSSTLTRDRQHVFRFFYRFWGELKKKMSHHLRCKGSDLFSNHQRMAHFLKKSN